MLIFRGDKWNVCSLIKWSFENKKKSFAQNSFIPLNPMKFLRQTHFFLVREKLFCVFSPALIPFSMSIAQEQQQIESTLLFSFSFRKREKSAKLHFLRPSTLQIDSLET
jgi:hypothetical protein